MGCTVLVLSFSRFTFRCASDLTMLRQSALNATRDDPIIAPLLSLTDCPCDTRIPAASSRHMHQRRCVLRGGNCSGRCVVHHGHAVLGRKLHPSHVRRRHQRVDEDVDRACALGCHLFVEMPAWCSFPFLLLLCSMLLCSCLYLCVCSFTSVVLVCHSAVSFCRKIKHSTLFDC